MTITELVFPSFKPETAKEALPVFRDAAKVFDGVSGLLTRNVGHIIRHNGEDISQEHRSVLSIEWDNPESFHAFVSSSPILTSFINNLMPYINAKATPQLFKPDPYDATSRPCLKSGAVHIFIGKVADKKQEVNSAWDSLISTLKQDKNDLAEWNGWGIEVADGSWLGVIGGKDTEELDTNMRRDNVKEPLAKLKGLNGIEWFVVRFDE